MIYMLLQTLLVLATMVTVTENVMQYASGCKWANDGCKDDHQCCSGRCFLAHPGTNPRCTPTDMGGPCLFSFHCNQRMQCGLGHRCCASNWGTCSRDQDCCHKYHKCKKIKGFVYKKCRVQSHLYLPKAARAALGANISYIASILSLCISCTVNMAITPFCVVKPRVRPISNTM